MMVEKLAFLKNRFLCGLSRILLRLTRGHSTILGTSQTSQVAESGRKKFIAQRSSINFVAINFLSISFFHVC